MQFSIRTLLLAITFVAITLGTFGIYLGFDSFNSEGLWFYPLYMLTLLWFWMPLLFIAFAIGRKKLTPWMLVAFAVCQSAAIGLNPLLAWVDAFGSYQIAPPVASAPATPAESP